MFPPCWARLTTPLMSSPFHRLELDLENKEDKVDSNPTNRLYQANIFVIYHNGIDLRRVVDWTTCSETPSMSEGKKRERSRKKSFSILEFGRRKDSKCPWLMRSFKFENRALWRKRGRQKTFGHFFSVSWEVKRQKIQRMSSLKIVSCPHKGHSTCAEYTLLRFLADLIPSFH